MADATTAVELSVQDAIQRASAQTGVPASVLQWIHSHEVNIGAQGPNQGTVTVDAGGGVRCGGFFGLCTNSGLNNGSDPFTQALTTANLLLSYGKNTWQAAISAFNLGPNAPVGGYGAQYPGNGGPFGDTFSSVPQPPNFAPGTSTPVTFNPSPTGGGANGTSPSPAVCNDWDIPLPGGNSVTLFGSRIFCQVSNFISTPQNWAKAGLTLLAIGLIIAGLVLYLRGEMI